MAGLIRRLAQEWWRQRRRAGRTAQVRAHKAALAARRVPFERYEDVAFVFQTFNRAEMIDAVVAPFVELHPRNVVLFADGCCDDSAARAHRLLPGQHHLVVQANDTHEVFNYRLALAMAQAWGCRFLVLMQDDDLYEPPVSRWLDTALALCRQDPSVAIVGLCSGFDLGAPPRRADEGFMTARYSVTRDADGRARARLGDYEELILSELTPTPDGHAWRYVAIVNRAPQVVSVAQARALSFFPVEAEPFQHDDYMHCLAAWQNGARVVHMPISTKRANVGTGGMRLYNDIRPTSRPAHMATTFNAFLDRHGAFWASGEAQRRVDAANRARQAAAAPDATAD